MRRLRDLLTTRGRAFVAAGITLVLCGIGLGFTDLTRIGVLLVALPLLSGVLMRRHDLRFSLERTAVPGRIQVDEQSLVTLSIENAGGATSPLLMAEEQLDYALGDRPRFVVPRLRRGDRQEVHYQVRSHVRGRHRLGPLGVRLRDPFGLSTRVAAISGSSDVLVLPKIVPLGGARPPGSGVGAEGAIPHMVALHGEDDVSIRAYRDGDDLRRIHWPATAKTGDLMVRQEDRPARRRAAIVLDSRARGHSGSGSSGSFEWAVTACASVAAHLIEQGYAVHLVCDETAEDSQAAMALDVDPLLDVLAMAETGSDDQFGRRPARHPPRHGIGRPGAGRRHRPRRGGGPPGRRAAPARRRRAGHRARPRRLHRDPSAAQPRHRRARLRAGAARGRLDGHRGRERATPSTRCGPCLAGHGHRVGVA